MIRQAAAKRYAEAAYLIAREDKSEDPWLQGLSAMSAVFGNTDAQAFLENGRVRPEQKAKFVEATLTGVDPYVLNMARMLLHRGKTGIAPQVLEAFQRLLDQERGVSHAVVTSAVSLSPDDLTAVQQRLRAITGGEVTVETHVDDRILGGLVVRIGDRLIDGSTRSRLLALKRQLEGVPS